MTSVSNIPRRVGFIVFPEVMTLDFVGPIDALATVMVEGRGGSKRPAYEVVAIGLDRKPVTTESSFEVTPAVFVTSKRLDEARRLLTRPRATIDEVARSVGFRSADAFRRAFERRFGVPPRVYRDRFTTSLKKTAYEAHRPSLYSQCRGRPGPA